MNLHLIVNGARHDVTGCERQARVVFLHELLAVGQAEYASVSAHGFGDEISGMRLPGVEEGGGVELHELHVFHLSLCTIDHRDTIACGNVGVGGGGIDGACAAGRHEGYAAQVGVYLAGLGVEDIGTVAFDIGGAASNAHAEMVLGDDFHGEMVLKHIDEGVVSHGFHQSALYLCACIVGMVQDTKLRVPAFAMEVESAFGIAVEVHAPVDQLFYLSGSVLHHLLYGARVGQPIARDHRIVDMLLEIIYLQVRYGRNAALCFGGIGFF